MNLTCPSESVLTVDTRSVRAEHEPGNNVGVYEMIHLGTSTKTRPVVLEPKGR